MTRLRFGLILGTAAITVVQLAAEAPSQKPIFEVVSIKPTASASTPMTVGNQAGGRFVGTNATVRMLLAIAFRPMQDYQILGGPSWLTSEHFDIDARAEGPLTQDEAALAVKAMLVDRFQMKTHLEIREMPSYILTVAKDGVKMKAVDPPPRVSDSPPTQPSVPRGMPTRAIFLGPGNIQAPAIQISQLVNFLSTMACRAVIDKTELKDYYDVSLRFMPESCPGEMRIFGVIPVAPITQDGNAGDASRLPSVFTALQEQLGLRLESARGPIEVLVIDSVSKPSEN